jgi:hypothetical protein
MVCPFIISRYDGTTAPPEDLGPALVVTILPDTMIEVQAKGVVAALCRDMERYDISLLGLFSCHLHYAS